MEKFSRFIACIFLPATKKKWFVSKIKVDEIKTILYIQPAGKNIKGRKNSETRSF